MGTQGPSASGGVMTVSPSDANHPDAVALCERYRRTRALITAEEIEAKAIELAGITRLEFIAHDTWFRNAYRKYARAKLLQPVLKANAARQPRDSRGRFQKTLDTIEGDKISDLSAALDAVGDHDSRVWSENVAACRCDQAPWWRVILKWMGW